ncbi:MAG: RluA family pseudouridine synthase [Dissulfuribacterales bacterium]
MSGGTYLSAGTSKYVFIKVNDNSAGQRLDKFLALKDLGLSRSQIQHLIQDGHIKVRGCARTSSSLRVHAGDCIDVHIPALRPLSVEPVPIPFAILYEDSHLLVLEKPAGLVVHPGAGEEDHTLVHGLLHHCRDLSGIGGYLRPGIVHRLDKNTSGLMVAAKDDETHRGLAGQFKEGKIGKTYLALVSGRLRDKSGRADSAVGRHPVNRKKMSIRSGNGRSAITEWQVVEEFRGASLLSLKIRTGRTHQIRVHMSSMGHPVLGDSLYGGPTEFRIGGAVIQIRRQMLHAACLQFTHPVTGEKMKWESNLPEDMTSVLERLRSLNA